MKVSASSLNGNKNQQGSLTSQANGNQTHNYHD